LAPELLWSSNSTDASGDGPTRVFLIYAQTHISSSIPSF